MKIDRKYINGKEYQIAKYPSDPGLILLIRLQQKFATPAGIVIESYFKSTGGEQNFSLAALLSMNLNVREFLESLTAKIAPEEVPALAREILRGTQIKDGQGFRDVDLDIDFPGDYLGIFMLLGHVLSYQYTSFLPVLAGRKQPPPAGENRVQAQSLSS